MKKEKEVGKTPRDFYDAQYKTKVYASEDHSGRLQWVASLIKEIEIKNLSILEVGCGRGQLQESSPLYVGLDISAETGRYLDKPFVCGKAESLPFGDQVFDLVMSFTVLEHLSKPVVALEEMGRVLRRGGKLILLAAWRVPPWRPIGLEMRRYSKLPLFGKAFKLCLPILNYLWTKAIFRIPIRIIREVRFALFKSVPLVYTSMKPNYDEFLLPDSDATCSMDNHMCALWLYSKNFRSGETSRASQRIFLRCGPLIMVKS